MRHTPIRWQILPTYLGLVAAVALMTALLALPPLRDFHHRRLEADLRARAQIIAVALAEIELTRSAALQEFVLTAGNQSGTRITLLDQSGEILADSDRDPALTDKYGLRREVANALAGRPDSSARFSDTSQRTMFFYALPLMRHGQVVGVVRTSLPLGTTREFLGSVWIRLVCGSAIAVLLAAAVSSWVARRLARPYRAMRETARHLGQGDLRRRFGSTPSVEAAHLAEELNSMAQALEERIGDLERRNREQETLLAGMGEGVLAVDRSGAVLTLNRAARELFRLPETASTPAGRGLEEIIRNPELLAFVRRTLDGSEPVEEELIIRETPPRFLRLHGSALRLASGEQVGGIVVFNDVTQQRAMEWERRELVASVSHELRTPVTAIRGFLETLRDGAIDHPEEAKRFVGIALRQSERLQALIEDLLRLARIEREIERAEVALTVQPVRAVLAAAVDACRGVPGGTEAVIHLDCPADLQAPLNAELLEQAVGNLLSNAIRYGAEPIRVSGSILGGSVEVSVNDRGPGIAREHRDRLFARFYVVDKARSRRHGGTGLGLAIVKHVARAHHGDVTVVSQAGEGTTFTIRIPSSENEGPAQPFGAPKPTDSRR